MWCYGVGVTEGIRFGGHWEALQWLREHGFRVNADVEKLETGEEDVVAQCLAWQERRGVARLRDRRRRGQGRRRRAAAAPRRRRARPALGDRLEVPAHDRGDDARGRSWNVGKFGDLHPFAVLAPVHVGGVTVKLATLHNEEDLARKDVRVGDEVIVLRAGDVIPQVVSPAPHARRARGRAPRSPRPPARCPFCDTPTVKGDGRLHPVPEPGVPGAPVAAAQALRRPRARWTSTGLGEKQVAALQQKGSSRPPGTSTGSPPSS